MTRGWPGLAATPLAAEVCLCLEEAASHQEGLDGRRSLVKVSLETSLPSLWAQGSNGGRGPDFILPKGQRVEEMFSPCQLSAFNVIAVTQALRTGPKGTFL